MEIIGFVSVSTFEGLILMNDLQRNVGIQSFVIQGPNCKWVYEKYIHVYQLDIVVVQPRLVFSDLWFMAQ